MGLATGVHAVPALHQYVPVKWFPGWASIILFAKIIHWMITDLRMLCTPRVICNDLPVLTAYRRYCSYINGCRNNSRLAMFSNVYGDWTNNAHSCSGCRTNSVVAMVTVGIASAAVAAMFPAAGTIACWLCLRLPDQYHLPILIPGSFGAPKIGLTPRTTWPFSALLRSTAWFVYIVC